MIFGTNGWSLRNYGICLLVALRCGLSGHGSAACSGSLSLQEPQSPPQISGNSPLIELGSDGRIQKELMKRIIALVAGADFVSRARLGAIRRQLRVGNRISVQYRQRRLHYRVVWMKLLEATKEYHVGVEVPRNGADTWGLDLRRQIWLMSPSRKS